MFVGDAEYEKHGIFEAITKPRASAAISGRRGTEPVEGEYLNGGGKMSDGFTENVEFFRLDFLDPDDVGLDDATDKAIGMAKYAREHGSEFVRIELVMIEGETLYRIDLKDEVKRGQVMSATSSAHLKAVFGL